MRHIAVQPRRFVAIAVVGLALSACGKRGDPLPPLRREPRPVGQFRVAQRGNAIEVRLAAPATSVDGVPIERLTIELFQAAVDGPIDKVGTVERLAIAPGETRILTLPLPPAGSLWRLAARARAGRHASRLSDAVALTVRPVPPAPAGLTVRQVVGGVVLGWETPQILTRPEPTPTPPPEEPPLPGDGPPASPEVAVEAPAPAGSDPEAPADAALAPAPVPSADSDPGAAPTEAAAPSVPPPPPQRGVYVYRRTDPGDYVQPLTADPLGLPGYFDDDVALGSRYCYVLRTVLARDPLAESAPSDEHCLTPGDIEPPASPRGLSVVAVDAGFEVSWSPPPEGVVSHRILRRSEGGSPEPLGEVAASETRWVDTETPPGQRLVYIVVAVDAAGNASVPASSAPVTRR